MRNRYLAAGVLGVATLTAVVGAVAGGGHPFALTLVAVGAPLTALLLAIAVSGSETGIRRVLLSLLIGGTVAPILVLEFQATFSAVVGGLVAPLGEAGRALRALRAEPTLLKVLTSPWALFFLINLAAVAPVAEELAKPIGTVLRRLRSPTDAFLCGAAAGAGFAAVENLLYASGGLYSSDAWVAISLGRSVGAAVHLLGTGLVSLGIYRVRREGKGLGSLLRLYALAVAAHAAWNGTIGVTIVLFDEREIVAGGLGGTALSWGITLWVALGVMGMLALGALLVVSRRLAQGGELADTWLGLSQPAAVAGWAALGAAMLVPAVILLLAFPRFLAL